jgi:hypothetical protein
MRRIFLTMLTTLRGAHALPMTLLLGSALSLAVVTAAQAQGNARLRAADPNEHSDGTLSPAAAKAMNRGPLPINEAEVATKQAADRDARREANTAPSVGRQAPSSPAEQSPAVQVPAVVGNHGFAGIGAGKNGPSPSDSTGTIGPFSYIQAVNSRVEIYNRNNNAAIAGGTLNQLAGNSATVNSFDPQIMWDPTTSRFYYAMASVFSSANNKISFGFSTTANPQTVSSADWCQYQIDYGSTFADFPKLGDSRVFIIIGVNAFSANDFFLGADIWAIGKPPASPVCPLAAALKMGSQEDLRDDTNARTFTPVPANQVDDNDTGYVVARNGTVPSTKLWFYNVTANGVTGAPVFGNPRGLTVPSYTLPPNAAQPTFTQLLDTSDARNTQAVQAINPDRGTVQSFYTQHTIRHGRQARSIVRWYEIDPGPAIPVLLRTGTIGAAGDFYFNAAISTDRRKDGATVEFGDSFVIEYNVSSAFHNIFPGIAAASSVSLGALQSRNIRKGVSGYRDFTCPGKNGICRWGDYSSAMPDPRPTTLGHGEVWITNQYSGVTNPPAGAATWDTWIAAVRP